MKQPVCFISIIPELTGLCLHSGNYPKTSLKTPFFGYTSVHNLIINFSCASCCILLPIFFHRGVRYLTKISANTSAPVKQVPRLDTQKNAFVERDKYDKWDASFPKLEMWRWDGHSCSFWNFVPVRFSRTLKNPLISQPCGPTLRPRKNKYQTNQSQFRALNCCVCPNDPKCHFQNCHLAIFSTVLPACNRKTIQP